MTRVKGQIGRPHDGEKKLVKKKLNSLRVPKNQVQNQEKLLVTVGVRKGLKDRKNLFFRIFGIITYARPYIHSENKLPDLNNLD
jgi:hypothetical protein